MAETFGKTTKGFNPSSFEDLIMATKFQSGSAGVLESISAYIWHSPAGTSHSKCAIYDAGLNLLANGTTEERTLEGSQDVWVIYNFPSAPSVSASTDYWLAIWTDVVLTIAYYDPGDPSQSFLKTLEYNGWPSPSIVPQMYKDREYSLYATYEEAPPPKKTLVQVALISIPPLIVLPTLGQILKVIGG